MSDASIDTIPITTRLRAWWEGYDPREYEDWRNARDGRADEDAEPGLARIELPELEPIEILTRDADGEGAQRIFGRGFISPGGPEQAVDMARALGLDPVQSVLDISLGLGGQAAALAEAFGIWVTGYERNPVLVERAESELSKLSSGDQVRVNHYEPETLDLPKRKFDVVICREQLHRIDDRLLVLSKVRGALKTWGQFLLTDYVIPSDDAPSKRLQTWMRSRGENVTLWTREQYEVALSNQGLDVRVVKDESEAHAEMIRSAFKAFVSEINANKAVTTTAVGRDALGKLAEDWSRLANLLQDGEVQLVRFLALKPEQTSA